MITFMYDKSINKVGCALIQAGCGGTIDNFNLQMFGTENWFLGPTKDMRMYTVKDQAELDAVIEYTKLLNKQK